MTLFAVSCAVLVSPSSGSFFVFGADTDSNEFSLFAPRVREITVPWSVSRGEVNMDCLQEMVSDFCLTGPTALVRFWSILRGTARRDGSTTGSCPRGCGPNVVVGRLLWND
jgi:hypothetical protein